MKFFNRVGMTFFLATVMTLTACVTINVYFPASQAERAAERIVDEILGDGPVHGTIHDEEQRRHQ